jgi:hypothetical protein
MFLDALYADPKYLFAFYRKTPTESGGAVV